MSSISGIYHPDGAPIDPESLATQNTHLTHRGPDGWGLWYDDNIGLGHQHLHTTPESIHTTLPHKERDLVITADARLDNRRELIAALDLSKSRWQLSDATLILEAYRRWGSECPTHLLGAYAFAIWNHGERELFAARDHMGIKPFYYAATGNTFVFGSELKAVRCHDAVLVELHERRVGEYLAGIHDDTESTFFEGIRRLPPATTMTVSPDEISRTTYWSLDPARELHLESDAAYEQRFKELFTDAVESRLRSTVSTGAMLSGGLDSSSIVAAACTSPSLDHHREPLSTFSLVFDDRTECDERDYITAVLAAYEDALESQYVHGDQHSPFEAIGRVLHHLEEPFPANNLFLHWQLYQAADDNGVGVLLDGYGGDITVSRGKGYFAELAACGRFLRLVTELRQHATQFETPLPGLVWNRILGLLAPRPLRRCWHRLRGRTDSNDHLSPVLEPGFIDTIGLDTQSDRSGVLDAPSNAHRQVQYESMTSGLLTVDLECADKAAAAFGIEPRYPFFDRRLMEFCLALPADQKFRDGWPRSILRRALDDILPDRIQWRTGKGNLAPNYYHELRTTDAPFLDRMLSHDTHHITPYVDVERVKDHYERFRAGDTDTVTQCVYWPVLLELWLRMTGLHHHLP